MTDTNDAAYGELLAERDIDAPREVVFRAFLNPEQIACFWGPVGMTTPVSGIKLEPWPGGAFETLMVNDADGSAHTMYATFLEIVEPERIVFKEHGMGLTSTMTFTDLGGRTRFRVHQTDVPVKFLGPETDIGFNSYLDKLVAFFAAK